MWFSLVAGPELAAGPEISAVSENGFIKLFFCFSESSYATVFPERISRRYVRKTQWRAKILKNKQIVYENRCQGPAASFAGGQPPQLVPAEWFRLDFYTSVAHRSK